MRFLANENFPLTSVNHLRKAGHDVVAIIQHAPGAKDPQVLAYAAQEQRIVLTFDRDYGELIYRRRLPAPLGVVYFRYTPITPEEPADQLIELVQLKNFSLENRFTVVERKQVRQRPLP